MIKLEAMGAIIWIYKKRLILLLNSATNPKQGDVEERML